MSEHNRLTKRQRAVLDDLFKGEKKEQDVLDIHHVARALYEKWFAEERFASEFERRIDHAYRQSRMILARNVPKAARRLVELTEKDGGETTRKACLDIISFQPPRGRKVLPNAASIPETPSPAASLSAETASRLLAVLAGQA